MNKCDCYHIRKERHYFSDYERGFHKALYGTDDKYKIIEIPECWGTKEQDRCSCGGDRTKCSFYEHVREEAQKQENHKNLLEKLDYCKAVCRDNIHIDIPNCADSPCTIEITADKICYPDQKILGVIDRETAVALKRLLKE